MEFNDGIRFTPIIEYSFSKLFNKLILLLSCIILMLDCGINVNRNFDDLALDSDQDSFDIDLESNTFTSDEDSILFLSVDINLEAYEVYYRDPVLLSQYDHFEPFNVVVEGEYVYVSFISINATDTRTFGFKIFNKSEDLEYIGEYIVGTSFVPDDSENVHVDVYGSIVYVSYDCYNIHGLVIVDCSIPETPVLLNELYTDGSYGPRSIKMLNEDFAILCDKSYIRFLDIRDLLSVEEIEKLYVMGCEDLDFVGDFAYVVSGSLGIRIVNITDLSTPVITAQNMDVGDVRRIQAHQRGDSIYAFVSYHEGLEVFDLTDPTAFPTEIYQFTNFVPSPEFWYIEEEFGSLLIVSKDNNCFDPSVPYIAPNQNGLFVLNVTNILDFDFLSVSATPTCTCSSIYLSEVDNLLFCVEQSKVSKVMIYEFSPSERDLSIVSILYGEIKNPMISENRDVLYVINGGVLAYNVQLEDEIILIGHYSRFFCILSAEYHDGILYLIDEYEGFMMVSPVTYESSSGLTMISGWDEVSKDPLWPDYTPMSLSVRPSDQFVFIVVDDNMGVVVVNTTDPRNLTLIFPDSNLGDFWYLTSCSGDRLYLSCSFSTNVYEVSPDCSTYQQESEYTSGLSPTALKSFDKYAIVAEGSDGVRVWYKTIVDGESTHISIHTDSNYAVDVEFLLVENYQYTEEPKPPKYLFITNYYPDISIPLVQFARYAEISVDGRYFPIYTKLEDVDDFKLTGTATGIIARDNIVYITDGTAGVKILRMGCFLRSVSSTNVESCLTGDTLIPVKATDTFGNEVETSFTVSRYDYCSGMGRCEEYKVEDYGDVEILCECDTGWEGDTCKIHTCFDKEYTDVVKVCNSRGTCVGLDTCECDFGYATVDCSVNARYVIFVLPSTTVALVFFLFLCCACGCCICIFCFFYISIFCFCSLSVIFILIKQCIRLSKYGKLRNFELHLKEQMMEDDTSIPHLRFQKDLFSVDFDEIETLSILGEGGSSSVVFKAIWKGRTVAFKCFKTRNLMNNQESFDEFEKEVEILSSVAHPNIIQFFGACLKPPRVGILMELCPKGELLEFVQKFRKEYMTEYPILQKLRLLTEIASAMEYLHSRNIIHRDLKCENVLISENEASKLMDFGLSRAVESHSVQKTKRIGTNLYMSPEIVGSADYDEKCDVFSFSIMVYVLLTENPQPYASITSDIYGIEMKVANNPQFRPPLELLSVTEEFEGWIKKDLLETCWSHDPTERLSFSKIRQILEKKGSVEGFEKKNVKDGGIKSLVGGGHQKKELEELNEKVLRREKENQMLKTKLEEEEED